MHPIHEHSGHYLYVRFMVDIYCKMEPFMKKYGLMLKALGITLLLLIIRLIVVYLNYDILSVTNLITAFIGGAIFTIAIIYTGTLADYKESERIPGEIATSIRTLYSDLSLIRVTDGELVPAMRDKVADLLRCINTNFINNRWNIEDINDSIDLINADISRLVDLNVAPNYVIKIKAEISNIDKISHRIKTITETSFIPAAYAIAEISAVGVIIILFLVKSDPFYEGIMLFTVICLLLVALLILIKDMDNPFEVGKKTFADIDLFLLWNLEKDLDDKVSPQEINGNKPD